MAKNGFNWYNDAYELNEFELAEREFSTTDCITPRGRVKKGTAAKLDAMYDAKEERARLDAELRSIVGGNYV